MAENEEVQAEQETEEQVEATDSPVETQVSESPQSAHQDYIQMAGGKVATSLDISAMRKDWPQFGVGDTIEVHYRIREGDKQRIQLYTGNVISIRGEGLGKSFVVRRVSHEIGVERIFPFHSPMIEKIVVTRHGKVRRAKLFYLRDKSGREGRIKEANKFLTGEGKKASKKKRAAKKVSKKTTKKVSKKAGKKTAKKVAKKTATKKTSSKAK